MLANIQRNSDTINTMNVIGISYRIPAAITNKPELPVAKHSRSFFLVKLTVGDPEERLQQWREVSAPRRHSGTQADGVLPPSTCDFQGCPESQYPAGRLEKREHGESVLVCSGCHNQIP